MKNCRICIFIRYFIGFILLIIVTSQLFREKLHHLSFINPWNAVKVIFTFGVILFLFKYFEYKKNKD